MGTDFWGVLTVAVSVALVLGRFAVARRLVPVGLREAHNANTAVMFGALYVMYGLIVGFSTYFVAYQYDTAQKSAQETRPGAWRRSTAWRKLPGNGAAGGAGPGRVLRPDRARGGVPLRREGRTSALAGATADELRRGVVVAFELGTEREDALGAWVLTLGGKLGPSREQRLLEVHEGIPAIL